MIQPFVARVKGCLNYSGCLTEQSCVVREKTGISTYRKFVFERGAVCNTRDGQRYTVVCKAGFSMTTPDHEMKLFSTSKGNVGYFLTREPDINRIPPTALKIVSIQDADKYRARIRSTENRIRSHEKAQSLLREIDNLQFTTEMRSEWNFCELEGLQGAADKTEECDDMSEEGVPDGLSYEVGEMVTVRTSGELNSATPFWLGCIVEVQTSSHCSNRLTVRWYLLTLSKRGTQSGSDLCFEGEYMPCEENADSSYDEIPSESVLCSFESLSRKGCIPVRAQQHTRQAIAESMEESDLFSHVGEDRETLGEEEIDLIDDPEVEDGARKNFMDVLEGKQDEGERSERNYLTSSTLEGLVCNSMITVRCAEQANVSFWLGKILSFLSESRHRIKVRWYKPVEHVSSDEEYYNCIFTPDPETAVTSIASSTVIASFKNLTKRGRVPKKAQTTTKKNM